MLPIRMIRCCRGALGSYALGTLHMRTHRIQFLCTYVLIYIRFKRTWLMGTRLRSTYFMCSRIRLIWTYMVRIWYIRHRRMRTWRKCNRFVRIRCMRFLLMHTVQYFPSWHMRPPQCLFDICTNGIYTLGTCYDTWLMYIVRQVDIDTDLFTNKHIRGGLAVASFNTSERLTSVCIILKHAFLNAECGKSRFLFNYFSTNWNKSDWKMIHSTDLCYETWALPIKITMNNITHTHKRLYNSFPCAR